MVVGKLDSHMQKNETEPLSYTIHKNKFKMDERLKCYSIKILEENTVSSLSDLGCSNFLLDTAPKAREIKAKMNYWVFIRIKSFAQQKKQSTKLKGKLWNRRRYLQVTYHIKG